MTDIAATPPNTGKGPYDPLKMLADYLKDNDTTSGNFRNFLVNRLGDQIIWYDQKSGIFKRRWERCRIIIIILSASIPFLVGLIDQDPANLILNQNLKLVIGAGGVIIAVLEGLNALYKSQELYIAYRVTSERLRHEFSSFLGGVGDYAAPGEASLSSLVAKVEGILAAENSQWADLARKNERAAMSAEIEKGVKSYLEEHGFKNRDDKEKEDDQTDNN